MGFETDVDQDIVASVSEEYMKAAHWLPFSALEIKAVFDTTELATLSEFMTEMRAASSDNARKQALLQKVEKYGGVVVKLLKMTRVLA